MADILAHTTAAHAHHVSHHVSLNHLHGGGNSHNWHAAGQGTFHGHNGAPDLQVGGNVYHQQGPTGGGHMGGGLDLGVTLHPSPNTDFSIGGWANSQGGHGGAVTLSTRW